MASSYQELQVSIILMQNNQEPNNWQERKQQILLFQIKTAERIWQQQKTSNYKLLKITRN